MEEEIVKEIMKECKLGEEKKNYIRLLIKICKDNNAGIERIKELYI